MLTRGCFGVLRDLESDVPWNMRCFFSKFVFAVEERAATRCGARVRSLGQLARTALDDEEWHAADRPEDPAASTRHEGGRGDVRIHQRFPYLFCSLRRPGLKRGAMKNTDEKLFVARMNTQGL